MYFGKYFDNHSHRKCDTLGARLAELRSTVQNSLKDMELVILFCYHTFSSHSQTCRKGKGPKSMDTRSSSTVYIHPDSRSVSNDLKQPLSIAQVDVFNWAEEV